LDITPYILAQRFVGTREFSEVGKDHPLIQWWLSLCGFSMDTPDETPWCAAFVNGIAWELRLPRSKSAAARSWLTVGTPVALADAKVGFDVVIVTRAGDLRGPEVLHAPGHVGFFAGFEPEPIPEGAERIGVTGALLILGGNQSDGVSIARFAIGTEQSVRKVLGVRRLA
jgi:uncharacterized protein (TIGR02594 family)